MYNIEDFVIYKEGISLVMNLIDLFLVVKVLVEMVDKFGQLFIVVRRDFFLKRVFFIWNREVSKIFGLVYLVVKVYFGGKEGIDLSVMVREFYISFF